MKKDKKTHFEELAEIEDKMMKDAKEHFQQLNLKRNKQLVGVGKRVGGLKVGEYGVYVQEKGVHEAALEHGINEGDIFYTVRLDQESWIDVIKHSEAILLSKLTSLEISISEFNSEKK